MILLIPSFLDECGFNDGDAIAKEIRKGTVKTEDLDKVNTFMSIDNTVIGLNEFVSDFIKKNSAWNNKNITYRRVWSKRY